MAALTDNRILETKPAPLHTKLKLADGAVTVFRGALLQYENSNIGYVELAADSATPGSQGEFAGIATENKTLVAGDNVSDGDNEVEVITRGSGDTFRLPVTSTITIANEGDPVYMDTTNEVDIASGISNTTGGFVGIIRQFISANLAWVQLVDELVA